MTKSTFFGVGVVEVSRCSTSAAQSTRVRCVPGDDAAPAGQRLDPHEDRARPAAHVLGVHLAVADLARRGSGRGRGRGVGRASRPCTPPESRVEAAGVDVEDVLHPRHELAVGLGRDGPALLQMRTKRLFLNAFPMVEWSRSGMSSINATCFSSSRSDQRG